MRLETVRMVADWLQNTSFGVNNYLATVPRDAGDPVPPLISAWTDPDRAQVQALAIFDETRHKWAANRQEEPPATPGLSVIAQGRILTSGEATPDGQIRATTAPVQIAIRYLTVNANLARAVQDGDYTMRAVARSIREFCRSSNENARKRNNVLIVLPEDPMEFYPIVEVVGDARVAGALVVNFQVRDYAPAF